MLMAFLHIGDHSLFKPTELPWHLIEPAHLVFVLLAIAVAIGGLTVSSLLAKRVHATSKGSRR
jgi:hypothetical protein